MEAIRQLRQEHALMERMLDHLGESLEPFDDLAVARAISFFTNYDDLNHHAKEEEVLFPELMSRAGDIMGGSIQVMRKEHTLSRAYLAKAEEVYSAALAGDRRAMQLLLRCLRSFIALEREHIKKEDIAVYNLSEQLLPPSLDQHMLIRFAEVTAHTIDAQAKALYEEFGLRPPPHAPSVRPDRDGTRSSVATLRGANPLDPRSLAPPQPLGRVEQTIASARKNRVIFEKDGHRAILLHDFGRASAVQSNQYLIIDDGEGMLLDPGGPKVYPALLAETMFELHDGKLRYLFFSHEDPDVCTSMNAWLMDTRADAYVSQLWVRFLSHFGVDELLEHRLKPVPDEGMWLELGNTELAILPAHFLHSCGNLQVYDPVAKVLFSGDLGASMGAEYTKVTDFGAHLRYMAHFHQRFMVSNDILRRWAEMARRLDIEIIAPQHGAVFEGKAMVDEFIAWCEGLECGIDLMSEVFTIPPRTEGERRVRDLAKAAQEQGRPGRSETAEEPAQRPGSELH